MEYHKQIETNRIEGTIPLVIHSMGFATGSLLIGDHNPRNVSMVIDTGSQWVWAYSEYAINMPKGVGSLVPQSVLNK